MLVHHDSSKQNPLSQERVMSDAYPTEKVCSCCKISKPLEGFDLLKSSRDGRRTGCKECAKIYNAKYRATSEGKARNWAAHVKRRSTPEGKAQHRREAAKRYATPEGRKRIIAAGAAYRSTVEGRKKQRAGHDKWKSTPEARAKINKASAKYAASPKGRISQRRGQKKRRALEAGVPIGDLKLITAWENSWRKNETACCFWCEQLFSINDCESDHVVPISKCGPHCVSNLVVSCVKCNKKKSNKPPEIFNPKRYTAWRSVIIASLGIS